MSKGRDGSKELVTRLWGVNFEFDLFIRDLLRDRYWNHAGFSKSHKRQ
jgi:hypothetical protein